MPKDAVKIDSVIPDGYFVNLLIDKKIFHGVLDLLPFVIIGLDNKFNIIYFNNVAESILGYDKENIIGQNWIDKIVSEKNKNLAKKLLRDSVNKLKIQHLIEIPVKIKSGNEKYIVWQLMIVIKDNKYRLLLMAGLDITERKIAEEKLKTACSELKSKNNDLNTILSQLKGREARFAELEKKLREIKK